MIDVPVEVKDALREGSYRKNYRVVVLATDTLEEFTIDNNNLVKESVSIDERMVSGDTLKFGLCEGSSLEFQYFGKENITGRQLQVFCDVNYEDAGTELTQDDSYTVSKAGNYEIVVPANTPRFDIEYQPDGGLIETIRVYSSSVAQTVPLNNCGVGDVVSFSSSNDISVTLRGEGGLAWYEIPMGFFTVKKCSRQASTGIIKVTAYNKLQSDYLDAKANQLIYEMDSDTGQTDVVTLQTIQDILLQDYQIEYKEEVDLHFTVFSTGIDETLSNVNCKLIGDNTTYHPRFSSYNSYELTWGAGNNKRVKFIGLDTYIEVLKNSIDSLKSTIYTSFQNPDTLWDNIKSYALSCFGVKLCIEYNHDTPNKVAYYTLSELMNDVYLSPTSSTIIAYGGDIEKLHYFQIPNLSTPSTPNFSILGIRIPETLTLPVSGGVIPVWTNPYSLYRDTDVDLYSIEYDEINSMEINTSQIPDVTLRDLVTANYELHCQFGQLSRETDLFSGVELNHSRLLPADTLYPATALYPNGAQESAFRSQYSKLWADEGNIHKWRYLIITYKGLDEEQNEKDFTLQRTINADGTDDYNMSDNWLFRNLVWTATDVGIYADAMVAKMQDITWFPFEMWAAGLPYLETGDEIEIPLGEETYTSYILQRQLKGIQNLQDTYINGTLDIF